jgi:hypothetical protein
MSITVLLDNKRYYLSRRDYKGMETPHRQVELGLTGKVIIQDFLAFRQESWDITLLCHRQNPPAGFGDVNDLRIAWGKQSIAFEDIDGNTRNVVITNELEFEPDYTIPVPDHLFRVKVLLQNLFAEA